MNCRNGCRLACEYGRKDRAEEIFREVQDALETAKKSVLTTPPEPGLYAREPNELEKIRALRPEGPRQLALPGDSELADRMAGAVLGRFAGCLLGVPVEGWAPEPMKQLAKDSGHSLPAGRTIGPRCGIRAVFSTALAPEAVIPGTEWMASP